MKAWLQQCLDWAAIATTRRSGRAPQTRPVGGRRCFSLGRCGSIDVLGYSRLMSAVYVRDRLVIMTIADRWVDKRAQVLAGL